jgi:RNA polymerase sigma factor (TIGR02999 family)
MTDHNSRVAEAERRNMGQSHAVTALLLAWGSGDRTALEKVLPLLHAELRQLARRYMAREGPGHTLQPTALINEAYVRLVEGPRVRWQDRAHFFAMAARLMRHILVDHARAKRNQKRGGAFRMVPLTDRLARSSPRPRDVLALDDALDVLATIDPRRSRVVELRCFGGLTVAEIGEVLDISPQTVMRDWRFARVWLRREITRGEA